MLVVTLPGLLLHEPFIQLLLVFGIRTRFCGVDTSVIRIIIGYLNILFIVARSPKSRWRRLLQ